MPRKTGDFASRKAPASLLDGNHSVMVKKYDGNFRKADHDGRVDLKPSGRRTIFVH